MKKDVEYIDEKRIVVFFGAVFKMPDITENEWGLIKKLVNYINLQADDLEVARQKINDIKTALYDD